MTVESDLYSTLGPLVGGRAFPDVGAADTALPYITYQQVGGSPVNFVRGLPSKRNGRFQVNAWAATRMEAAALIRQAHDAITQAIALQYPIGLTEPIAIRDEETKAFGALQDFSIWFEA
jgi:hypothetical protein